MSHLGDAIKKARGSMSQTTLAKGACIDQAYLSRLESAGRSLNGNGVTHESFKKRRELLTRIAEICKVDPGVLILAWGLDDGFFAFVDELHEQGQRLVVELVKGRRYPAWFWSAVGDLLDQVKR